MPDRVAFAFLPDGETEAERWTYADLHQIASAAGEWISGQVEPGARVLISHASAAEWLRAFFGCVYAAAVAVPLAPLRRGSEVGRLARDCDASLALLDAKVDRRFAEDPALATIPRVIIDALPRVARGNCSSRSAHSHSTLVLQYTSGSTGSPKGVIIDNSNALANQEMIRRALSHDEHSTFVGWLPLFHDMGLVGTVLQPLYLGAASYVMPPSAFLERPVRWLRAISSYRAHTSGGPNFAYALCHERVRADEMIGVDLSSWHVAFNGAEPVNAATLERFAAAFEPSGFDARSFVPCYGLAEATLFVSGTRRTDAVRVIKADRLSLAHGTVKAASAAATAERVTRLVSCGAPAPGLTVSIHRSDGLPCASGEVGEVRLAGPSISRGYWKAGETVTTQVPSRTSSLPTGDLGTLLDGELFVLGRIDDLIVLRGNNYHPNDIERSALESHEALVGCSAAAILRRDGDHQPRLTLVQEISESVDEAGRRAVIVAIRAAVARDHGVMLDDIIFVPRRAIPRTTSGKVRRHACHALIPSTPRAAGDPSLQADDGLTWLRGAVAAVLGCKPSEVDATITPVAHGIDSVGAARVCHQALDDLCIELPLSAVLGTSTIGALAAAYLGRPSVGYVAASPKPAVESTRDLPMSAGQRARWFFQQYAPGSSAYHVACAGRLTMPIGAANLACAIDRVVERHPALRCVFQWRDGEPRQRVVAASSDVLEVRSVSGASAAELDALIDHEVHLPFEIERGPSYRFVLFRGAQQGDVLLVCAHHILVDMWSIALLFREIDELLAVPAVELPAADALELRFAQFEMDRVAAFEAAGGRERLLARLDGARPLELPPRGWTPPDSESLLQLDSAEFAVDLTTVRRLRELSSQLAVTPYTLILSAYAAVLHRYCGVENFLIGSPTWGRGPQFRSAVGCFVNTMVIRCDVRGDPTFADLVRRLHTAALAAMDDADYPYALATRAWRDATRRNMPVEALLTFHGAPVLEEVDSTSFALGRAGGRMELRRLSLESLAIRRREFEFPFDLALGLSEGRLVGYLATLRGRVPPRLGEQMAGHFAQLLERAACDTDWRVSSSSLVADTEIEALERWNTPRIGDAARTLVELFDDQAARALSWPAVVERKRLLTYGELAERSRAIAGRLRKIRRGGPVGLLIRPGIEWTIAALGSVRARRGFLALEPADPPERLAAMIADSGASIVITSSECEAVARGVAARLQSVVQLEIDSRDDMPAARVGEMPPLEDVVLDDIVYVIYTSGSTGTPKGVPISHRNLEHLMRWLVREFRIGPETRTLQSLPVCFDFGLEEIFSTLLGGGTLYSFGPDERRDGDRYLDLLARHEITMAYWTPSLAESLVARQHALPSLRVILLGGETLDRSLVRRLRNLVESSCRIFNGYGPTEAAINSSMHEVVDWSDAATWSRSIPIGASTGRTRLYVLNAHGAFAPPGVPGELFIGGPGVARGYLGRPGQTAAAFSPDPFAGISGAIMYRTGDRVRWLPDGVIEFLGRADRQVKLRGHRVEPDEVEHVVRRAPGVRDAAVIALSTVDAMELVAFVVGAAEAINAVEEFARRQLPRYMLPAQWIPLTALPTTPNGKTDRSALISVAGRRSPTPNGAIARSRMEADIQEAWRAALGLASVGRTVSFFDLGGHSLAAVAVQRTLQAKLGFQFPVSALFEHQTVAELAGFLSGLGEDRQRYHADGVARAALLRSALQTLRARGQDGLSR